MEKKWWYIRGVQVQLLILILCVTQPVAAKPTPLAPVKKGKGSSVAKPHSSPSVKSLRSQSAAKPGKGATAKPENGFARAKDINVANVSPSHVRTNSLPRLATPSTKQKEGRRIAVSTNGKSARNTRRRTAKSLAAESHKKRTPPGSPLQRKERHLPQESAPHLLQVDDEYSAFPDSPLAFSPETAPFVVQLNDERLAYRINSVFVLPAEERILAVEGAQQPGEYLLQTTLDVKQLGPNVWSWRAPQEPGLYPLKVLHAKWGATLALNVFVMVPFSQARSGYLNGYRIGRYPSIPLKQLAAYDAPRGFVEVTRANEDAQLSPHFRLRQFLCKQDSEYPKYVVLDQRLLFVLEFILGQVNKRGYHCPTFEVMSGYRTPYYNRAIGNSTTYSRHLWGDAADIFVDTNPRDGEMDDLNRDGMENFRDAKILYDIVNDIYAPRIQRLLTSGLVYEPRLQRLFTGGLARYPETDAHGPFVHVDVRGIYTRWGR